MKKINIYLKSKVIIVTVFSIISAYKAYSQNMDMNQTLSDGAQRNTIAFDGLAFLTGNFCACTFIPPGKVSDYFGFQYLRDNDITHMGHTTDFNTVIANNLLYVLDSTQKAELVALAKTQVPLINLYAYNRFPLIKAFVRLRDKDIPAGSSGLDSEVVKSYSAQLYRIDGKISIQRALLYAGIIKNFNARQKHYLDSVSKLGMKNMPVLPDQIDKRPLNNNEFVAVMSYAGDIFAWYVGNVTSDVYFCPEREADYFGGFYIKDAPAMGQHGYSIDTNLTQNGGSEFIAALTSSQAALITDIVDTQKTDLYGIVAQRTNIANLLRGYLTNAAIDTSAVLSLSEIYGQLDGDISYHYATNFSKVGWSLTLAERDTLNKIRNLDKYPCVGAYLYSDSIGVPDIINTDFFFIKSTGIKDLQTINPGLQAKAYPNPFNSFTRISFTLSQNDNVKILITDITGRVIKQFLPGVMKSGINNIMWDCTDNDGKLISSGLYFCKVLSSRQVETLKLLFVK